MEEAAAAEEATSTIANAGIEVFIHHTRFFETPLTALTDDDFEDRRPQRRRYEEPLAVTLRKTILSIAESPMRRVEDDVPYIAKTIADNYFDSDLTSGFVNLVIQM